MPTIDLKDLGPCLKAYRIYCGIENARTIESTLNDNARTLGIHSIRDLEEGRVGGRFTLAEVKNLLAAYNMSELMVDHLLVSEDSPYIVRQVIGGFDPHPATKHFESNAKYFIPQRLLRPAPHLDQPFPHAFFVRVVLSQTGDKSERHDHPGDELTLCRRGMVRMSWERLGIHAELNPGDYVHFHADQEHVATNIGPGEAELFVIRNYMIAGGGPRRKLYRDAQTFDRALLRGRKNASTLRGIYKEGIGRWINQILRSRDAEPDMTATVQDPVGLARQLERMGWYGRKLHRKAKQLFGDAAFPLARYEEIMAGFFKNPVTKSDLDHLAGVCKVPPVLLYPFMFPRTPGFCVIRFDDDFLDLPGIESNKAAHVRYRYPRQNLADSGLTISRLDLSTRFPCPENRHFGTELCIPIAGNGLRVDLDVPKGKNEGQGLKRVFDVATEKEYFHYVSGYPHWVTNYGKDRASVLVVRFFE